MFYRDEDRYYVDILKKLQSKLGKIICEDKWEDEYKNTISIVYNVNNDYFTQGLETILENFREYGFVEIKRKFKNQDSGKILHIEMSTYDGSRKPTVVVVVDINQCLVNLVLDIYKNN